MLNSSSLPDYQATKISRQSFPSEEDSHTKGCNRVKEDITLGITPRNPLPGRQGICSLVTYGELVSYPRYFFV